MDYSHILHRFPIFELSYETFAHKKVPPNYDICMAIPTGKKQLIWFTYDNTDDIALLIDINKSKQITKMSRVNILSPRIDTYFGTLLYGTMVQITETNQVFVIEDIYHYEGINLKKMLFGEKLTYLYEFFTKNLPNQQSNEFLLALPYMRILQICTIKSPTESAFTKRMHCVPLVSDKASNYQALEKCKGVRDDADLDSLPFYESFTKPAKYISHHIQFRSTSTIVPYLNHIYKKPQAPVEQKCVSLCDSLEKRTDFDYRLPIYLGGPIFRAVADIRDDVYHLFAYEKDAPSAYVGVAYIGTRVQSKYMNSLFRKIRENINIDYGEESEDEECFQDLRIDKYVDLACEHKIECVFNKRFRMWEPVKKVDNGRYTHIGELVSSGPKRVDPKRVLVPRPYQKYINQRPGYKK